MKPVTAIWLVALGLVVGVVIGQLLHYHQINLLETIKKIFKR